LVRIRKRQSTKLLELKAKARRQGWLKWLRTGPGEEADERALLNGCWFSPHRANHWLKFADTYGTLTEGAFKGKPFKLLEWQQVDSARVFGWLRNNPEWGMPVRRFRFWYEEVPKKNGKTPLLSLVGNYLLFGDSFERQINLYLAATTRKQAERCLMHAIRQVKNSDELRAVANIRKLEGFSSIEFGDNNWQVVAADPESADGVNGHCLADELHRWKGFEFFNALKYMIASQPEGLFVGITTAGADTECVCKQLHDHTLAVNSGRVEDESFYGAIYAATEDDDPHDEKTWLKANPSLGTTRDHPLKLSTFRQDYESCKQDPTQWPSFLRLRLNLWLSSENGWLDQACPRRLADWDAGPTERKSSGRKRIDCYEAFTLDDLEKIKAVRVGLGMDFASVRDTNAAVLSIEDEKGIVRVHPWFWLPEAEALRQAKRVPYQSWAKQGLITLTPGDVVDYSKIFQDLVAICKRFGVEKFYYDSQFQAEWLMQRLEEDTGAERVVFPQTIMAYGPVVKEAERRIISHDLRHNGHHVLTWQMANAVAYENANGDKRLVKRKRGDYRKVDGPQAMLQSLHDVASGSDDGNYYDEEDVEII
jgi:phage terminase large subunit-like protein